MRGLMRVRAKPTPFEIAADFETIAECVEIVDSFTSDTGLQAACGSHFRGHETPFDQLIAINGYAVTVKRTFGADDPIDNRILEVFSGGPRRSSSVAS